MPENRTNSGDSPMTMESELVSELRRINQQTIQPANSIEQSCRMASDQVRSVRDSLLDTLNSTVEAVNALTEAMAADLEERGAAYTQELEKLKSGAHQMDRAMHGAVAKFATMRMRADNGRSSKQA